MLSDVAIETATIKAGKHSFEVSGVTFDMVAQLVAQGDRGDLQKAAVELESIFQDTQAGGVDVKERVGSLLVQLPTLFAKLIASAAGEPKEWQKVSRFNVAVQLDALIAIGKLTFEGEDAIKNFVSGLLTLMQSMKNTVNMATEQTALATGAKLNGSKN